MQQQISSGAQSSMESIFGSAEVSGSPYKGVVDITAESSYGKYLGDAKGYKTNHSSWYDPAFKIVRKNTLLATQKFREAVAALPATFDVDKYAKFIDL